MIELAIPRLSQTPDDLEWLTRHVLPRCLSTSSPARLDFTSCDFLTPSAVAYLGGLLRLASFRHGALTVNWASLPPSLYQYLCQVGLLPAYGIEESIHHGHAVPYREDPITGVHPDLARYLDSAWLDHPWLTLTAPQRQMIVGRLLEIYTNACDHSKSPVGIFTAGQHYPRSQRLLLTAIDLGHGIPATVRQFLGRPTLSSCDALAWAFQRGHTTQPSRPRGLGLDLLASFIRHHHGRLDLLSGDAHMAITATHTHCHPLPYQFPGTAVCLALRCHAHFYQPPSTSTPLQW